MYSCKKQNLIFFHVGGFQFSTQYIRHYHTSVVNRSINFSIGKFKG